MKMEDLKKIAEKDLRIERDQLDTKSVNMPLIQGRWLQFFYEESLILKAVKIKYKTVYKDRWLYFMGKADPIEYVKHPLPIKILKPDLQLFLDTDEAILQVSAKVDLQQEKVNYIENMLKTLNAVQWNIRNCIDYLKFSNGQ